MVTNLDRIFFGANAPDPGGVHGTPYPICPCHLDVGQNGRPREPQMLV